MKGRVKLRCTKTDCTLRGGFLVPISQKEYIKKQPCPYCKSKVMELNLVRNLTLVGGNNDRTNSNQNDNSSK